MRPHLYAPGWHGKKGLIRSPEDLADSGQDAKKMTNWTSFNFSTRNSYFHALARKAAKRGHIYWNWNWTIASKYMPMIFTLSLPWNQSPARPEHRHVLCDSERAAFVVGSNIFASISISKADHFEKCVVHHHCLGFVAWQTCTCKTSFWSKIWSWHHRSYAQHLVTISIRPPVCSVVPLVYLRHHCVFSNGNQ